MDDELEDRILYQAYLSHMKLISKFAVGIPTAGIGAPLSHFWRLTRTYFLKPELLLASVVLIIIIIYLRIISPRSQNLFEKIQYTLERTTSKVSKFQFLVNNSSNKKIDWEFKQDNIAAYAVQGHRAHMEDRFVINNDINNTGVSLFAIFDGHGGEFAANYARDNLIPNIIKQIAELKDIISGKIPKNGEKIDTNDNISEKDNNPLKDVKNVKTDNDLNLRKKSWSKTLSASLTDDCKNVGITDPELLSKIDSLSKTITKEVRPNKDKRKPPKVNIASYLNGNEINYSKLITDQVLAADRLLVEAAKKNMDVAGTSALIAIIEGNKLIVANVGDSREVMCDAKGNAIPLSFDHKPQQIIEKNISL